MTDAPRPSTLIAHGLHLVLLALMLGGLYRAGITPEVMQTNGWWLPFLVVHAGILFANLAMAVLLGRNEPGDQLTIEGRRADLVDSRAIVIEQLRNLESERHKLSDEDYARERAALIAVGAEAARQLDLGSPAPLEPPPMSDDPNHDPVTALVGRLRSEQLNNPAAFEQALSRLGLRAAPPSGSLPGEWRGAGITLLLVGLVALLFRDAGETATDRVGNMGMTGGDSVGMAEPSQVAPAPATPSPEVVALQQRLAADPNDLEALNKLTENALGTQDIQGAMELNARALEVSPTDPDARAFQQVLRAFIGRQAEALTALDALILEHPTHHRSLVYRGLLGMRDEPARSVEMFERAAAIEDSPQLQQAIAQARALAAGGDAALPPPAAADPGAPAAALVKGRIELAPGVDGTAGKVLFVSLRPAAGGPPVAALKLGPGPFPMDFAVTTADVLPMAGNRPLPDAFLLVARLDSDGDPLSRPETDPAAEAAGVSKGAEGLTLTLK